MPRTSDLAIKYESRSSTIRRGPEMGTEKTGRSGHLFLAQTPKSPHKAAMLDLAGTKSNLAMKLDLTTSFKTLELAIYINERDFVRRPSNDPDMN